MVEIITSSKKHLRLIIFKSRKQTFLALILFIIIVFFAIENLFGGKQSPQYQTVTVQRGLLISAISESGNVTDASQVSVTSPTTGVIEEIYVQNGNPVNAGDNLFKVKSTATPQAQASALASYLSAKATLDSANATLYSLQSTMFSKWQTYTNLAENSTYQNSDGTPNTTNRILPAFTTAQDDWLSAEANYKNQQSVISQAQASTNAAWLAYQATQDSTVTAPIAGIVANLSVTVGGSVNAATTASSSTTNSTGTNTAASSTSSSSVNASTTILLLVNPSNVSVVTQVSEVDIPKVHPTEKATITLDALPNKTFVGVISQVDSIGTITSGVVTYNVYTTFTNPIPDIKPGMSATVNIQTARKDNVLSVPSTAVQTQSGQSVVRVFQNGILTTVPVQTGISSDTQTEIASGLSEGETVVVGFTSQNQAASGATTSPFSRNIFGGGFGGGGRGGGGAAAGR